MRTVSHGDFNRSLLHVYFLPFFNAIRNDHFSRPDVNTVVDKRFVVNYRAVYSTCKCTLINAQGPYKGGGSVYHGFGPALIRGQNIDEIFQ